MIDGPQQVRSVDDKKANRALAMSKTMHVAKTTAQALFEGRARSCTLLRRTGCRVLAMEQVLQMLLKWTMTTSRFSTTITSSRPRVMPRPGASVAWAGGYLQGSARCAQVRRTDAEGRARSSRSDRVGWPRDAGGSDPSRRAADDRRDAGSRIASDRKGQERRNRVNEFAGRSTSAIVLTSPERRARETAALSSSLWWSRTSGISSAR